MPHQAQKEPPTRSAVAPTQRKWGCYVFMILRPTLRFLTRPRPPVEFAARRLAALIRPPLLFFTVITPSLVLLDHPEIRGRRDITSNLRASLLANSHSRAGLPSNLTTGWRRRVRASGTSLATSERAPQPGR